MKEKQTACEITVFMEPEGKTLILPRPKTVLQLLNRLGLRPSQCLVISEGGREGTQGVPPGEHGPRSLLTHDLAVLPCEKLTIRKVVSTG